METVAEALFHGSSEPPGASAYLARVLLATYDPADINALLAVIKDQELYNFNGIKLYRGKGLIPNTVTWQNNDTRWIGIVGTTNASQALEQQIGWSVAPTVIHGAHVNEFYADGSQIILDAITNDGFVGWTKRYHVFGHSYGGALAIVLALRIQLMNSKRLVSCTTFGNPKPGYRDLAELAASRLTLRRWIGQGDLISWLPPLASQAPLAFGASLPLSQLFWTRYDQSNGAIILNDVGTVQSGKEAPQVKKINDVDIAKWATGAGGELGPEHSLPVYIRRLLAIQQRLDQPVEVPATPIPVAPVTVSSVTLDSIKPLTPAKPRKKRRR